MYGFPPINYIKDDKTKKISKIRSLPENNKININQLLLLTKTKSILKLEDDSNNINTVQKIE
jgi:hypothetical protein